MGQSENSLRISYESYMFVKQIRIRITLATGILRSNLNSF